MLSILNEDKLCCNLSTELQKIIYSHGRKSDTNQHIIQKRKIPNLKREKRWWQSVGASRCCSVSWASKRLCWPVLPFQFPLWWIPTSDGTSFRCNEIIYSFKRCVDWMKFQHRTKTGYSAISCIWGAYTYYHDLKAQASLRRSKSITSSYVRASYKCSSTIKRAHRTMMAEPAFIVKGHVSNKILDNMWWLRRRYVRRGWLAGLQCTEEEMSAFIRLLNQKSPTSADATTTLR